MAFQASDTQAVVNAEVQQRKIKGESMSVIMAAAKLASVKADTLASALVGAGNSPADVVAAMVGAGFDAALVAEGATRTGANSANSANRAAGDTSGGGDLSGNGLGNNAGNSGNGPSFRPSPASTVGGGGRSGVSPS